MLIRAVAAVVVVRTLFVFLCWCSCAADDRNWGTTPLPTLLKFHKVAGATVAGILRGACPIHVPPFFWSYERCPATPHGHGGLALYRRRGRMGLMHCLQHNNSAPVVMTTILRDPVDRLLSSLHFFYGDRYKRWARTEQERARSVLLAGAETEEAITEDLLRHLETESMNHWRQPINEYTAVFGRLQQNDEKLTHKTVETAIQNLEAEFMDEEHLGLLGLQRDVGSFAVRLSMVMQWPLNAVCIYSAHVNQNRTRSRSLSVETLQLLRRAVMFDTKVYEAAEQIYARMELRDQQQKTEFAKLREEFDSPEFKRMCSEQWRTRAKSRRQRGGRGVSGC